MKLHLDYQPPFSGIPISQRHKLFLCGSCFAENIGALLFEYYFPSTTNPGGIIFDAVSLARSLRDAVTEDAWYPSHVLERGGRFFSYLHHSSVSAGSEEELLQLYDEIRSVTRKAIRAADFIIITLGTAFTYYHKEFGIPVANCHKQPGSDFSHIMSSPHEIVRLFSEVLPAIRQINSKVHFIFTVSPVKYLKDGPVNNNISKSSLLLAVHELVETNDDCSYFPAYELVTDDLRDYRFYKEDLAHPNDLAIKYVWEKFSDAWFSPETKQLNREIGKLNNATAHRTIHSHPEEKEKLEAFITRQRQLISQMEPSIRLQ